jgi:threonine/homoserine/homoserine lactone efflux protein
VTGAVLAVPGAAPVLLAAAAAYFAWLAWRIATAPPLAEGRGQGRRPTVGGGVFLSLVNPKGYAAMAALFSGFVLVRERVVADAALKVALLLAVIVASSLAWLLLGAALTRRFREPRANRVINATFALLLVASVALALAV